MRILPIAAFLMLCGCTAYQFAGQSYASRTEAEAAARSHFSAQVATAPVGSKAFPIAATVILPDRARIETSGVFKPQGVTQDQIDYVATILETELASVADAVRRSAMFSDVSVRKTFLTEAMPAPTDDLQIMMVLHGEPASASYGWKVQDPSGRQLDIPFDTSLPQDQRYAAWINKIAVFMAEYLSAANIKPGA